MTGGGSTAGGAASSLDGGALPPAGFQRCGAGTVTPASALSACRTYPTQRTMRCEALQLSGGAFEAWCSPSEVYVRVELDDVRSTAVRTCSRSIPLPDGGVLSFNSYPLEWDPTLSEFSAALNPGPFQTPMAFSMARFVVPPQPYGQLTPRGPEWQGALTFEGRFANTADAGAGPIGMGLQRVNCEGQPQFNMMDLLLAVPIRFGR